MRRQVTIIIPALNEEPHIEATVLETVRALEDTVDDYEIFVFNDGSSDRTGAIADRLAEANPKIEVIHHETNRGLGYVYKSGVRRAALPYVLMIPGDNEVAEHSIHDVCSRIGDRDILITYHANPEIRPKSRQVISRAFASMIRFGSGLSVRYFNGLVVHRTDVVRRALAEISDGFAYQAEILVRLIQMGYDYEEVGLEILPRPKTNAFRFSNLVNTVLNTGKLVLRLKFGKGPDTLPNMPSVSQRAEPLQTIKV